jgi:phenylalanine-4-hydroxylase
MAQRTTNEDQSPGRPLQGTGGDADAAEFLDKYLTPQQYGAYSSDAQTVWREVMRRNEDIVSRHAERIHPAYLAGLERLQLPRRVPRTEELNERLHETGWRIVTVDGYIPSTAYATLMAQRIFPVSLRIRRPEHVDYAPEPDMVHDILGHLPMLFCAEHRDYLQELASVARHALPNALDMAFHESVKHMAQLKSAPERDEQQVSLSERRVEQVYAQLVGNASEVTHLRRIYTWSIEFGLFYRDGQLVVHGAALLSAPTELERVLTDSARLVPYSLDVLRHENAFSDLLERYFVAKDYAHLHDVLSAYEGTMLAAGRTGTSEVRQLRPHAFEKARKSNA